MGLRKEPAELFAVMTEKRLRMATRVIVMEAKFSGEAFPGMVIVS